MGRTKKQICINLDKDLYDELHRFGEVSGIGPCNLIVIGAYIIARTFEEMESQSKEILDKSLEEIFANPFKWPNRNALIDFKTHLNDIPDELKEEVMDLIAKCSNSQQKKTIHRDIKENTQ